MYVIKMHVFKACAALYFYFYCITFRLVLQRNGNTRSRRHKCLWCIRAANVQQCPSNPLVSMKCFFPHRYKFSVTVSFPLHNIPPPFIPLVPSIRDSGKSINLTCNFHSFNSITAFYIRVRIEFCNIQFL